MAITDRAGILGFTYTRTSAMKTKSGRIVEPQALEITDEQGNYIDNDLEYDSTQKEILAFIVGFRRGREVAAQRISIILEGQWDQLNSEVSDMFNANRMKEEKDWEERTVKLKDELKGLLSAQGNIDDPSAHRERVLSLYERLRIFSN